MAAYRLAEVSDTWVAPPSRRPFDTHAELYTPVPAPSERGRNRQIGGVTPIFRTEVGGSREPVLTDVGLAAAAPSLSTSAAAQHTVKGVVDDLEGSHARVTLFYGGRENRFLLDAHDLEAAGVAYPGALFQIVIENNFAYRIVHSAEEEEAARKKAPRPDLSFLDE